MTEREALKLALETLKNSRQTHYYCEDTWYSCPKHEDGCANDSQGSECNCGSDSANLKIDKTIKALEEALAKQEQGEPVAWMHKQGNYEEPSFRQLDDWEISNGWKQYPLYTTPQQRKPLTEEQIRTQFCGKPENFWDYYAGVRYAEAAHGIKE
jgi:hypothetical protein